MINISKKKDCCGCNACGDVCPKHSITFKIDKEGFWYPEVEMDTCIDCHLCEKVCPLLNKEEYKNIDGYVKPKTYALVHKNIEVRFDSTSGGAFTALAEEVYKQGGFVGGAIYNEDWSVSQFLSSSKNDLPKLRSSKYLQSHFDGFYKSVKEALKTEKPVLVCGSPCQMAAMFRYLKKPYENLIIVDYICRGIASPMYFRKWINYLENKHNSKVIFYKAKSKELGWRKLSTRIEYANGEADVIAGHDNPWLMMQYKVPEICRPSCFECSFKGFPRTSDITMGDFWGIDTILPEFYDNMGCSVAIVRNHTAMEVLDAIENLEKQEVPLEDGIKKQANAFKPSTKPEAREAFWNDYRMMSFKQVAHKYFAYKATRRLKCWVHRAMFQFGLRKDP